MPSKVELRTTLRARRAARSVADRETAGAAVSDVLLATPEVAGAAVVAAYVGIGTEPPTFALLDALRRRDCRVLLPLLGPDNDLDWSAYDGREALAEGPHRLLQPTGARLGRDAIRDVPVVVVPALAVDGAGHRLGRGAGAFDRALPRSVGLTVAVVFDDELLDDVPVEAHDVAVAAVATPAGLIRFSPVG